MNVVGDIIKNCTDLIASGGLLVGFLLILLESFLPFLPLGVIVTLNINAFGFIFGTLISWLATCTGCILVYTIIYNVSNKYIYKLLKKKNQEKVEKAIQKFKNISLPTLTLIITLPFTPSFIVNILSGVSGIKKEKFLTALFIGKLLMISFCGFIGKSLIESITDPKAIVFIILTLFIAYFLSKFVSKKMHIE